jgi:hypothetical protein
VGTIDAVAESVLLVSVDAVDAVDAVASEALLPPPPQALKANADNTRAFCHATCRERKVALFTVFSLLIGFEM